MMSPVENAYAQLIFMKTVKDFVILAWPPIIGSKV